MSKHQNYEHHKEKQHENHSRSSSSAKSSSLLEILQSFGIIVKTKVYFHDRRRIANLEERLLELKHKINPKLEGANDDLELENQTRNGNILISSNPLEYFTNIKRSKIVIRFKCDFDHKSIVKDVKTNVDFNVASENKRNLMFNSYTNQERKNTNVMHIEFDLKFDSIVDVVKYLNIAECKNVNLMLENEILSRLVEILDVDNEKKQLYIKLKTFDTNSTTNLCNYFLMGKIDGSNSCFMLDLTRHFTSNLKTIDSIYRHFTPNLLKNRIYDKHNTNTFHDCKDVGIYRVLIGCFFYGITDSSAGWYIKRTQIHPYNILKARVSPEIMNTGESFSIIVEKTCHHSQTPFSSNLAYSTNVSGIVDVGFYKFELKSICGYHFGDLDFKREVYHFSL
ncbi:predicted protein [Naegleria gruberi]|uniref:Predicted protein n=1 Tax=Naegleria gruberi TaxID=5762 RepID=D2W269_NAEGR|nr:uncharacterized protein NAEGRDRAFT_75480 [Naegleria gruberi]EFC36813.1 predicted protein [Naegleria gruberi]|eukprot:XP_002669557.1 predicted protein [Naegleria gruberi strain NEG-M]